MATIDSIVAELRSATDRLHEAIVHARAARDMAEELRLLFDQLGTHDLVERMRVVADHAGEVLALLMGGVDAGEQLIANAEAVRRSDAMGSSEVSRPPTLSVASAATKPAPSAEDTPVTPGWQLRQGADVPEHIRQAAARLRPRPPEEEERYTTGIVDGETIHSGGKNRSLAADLDHGPLPRAPVTFYEHVEAKVAARMRQEHRTRPGKRQRLELTIDNLPCGSIPQERNYVWGCDRILGSILPKGSTLVVWATQDGGRTFWRHAYRGTGERIRA